MCAVSSIGDNWQRTFPDRYPWYPTVPVPIPTPMPMPSPPLYLVINPTRQEFDDLKAEVEELKKLLKAAKEFDEKTGQKDCEMDEKVKFIKEIAKFVGVDLNEVFGK